MSNLSIFNNSGKVNLYCHKDHISGQFSYILKRNRNFGGGGGEINVSLILTYVEELLFISTMLAFQLLHLHR